MNRFTALDFETGNPQRVSACALGYAIVEGGKIVDTGLHLIKPVGGHAAFQTRIHGITDDQTKNKPMFDSLYPQIRSIFNNPLVGHSNFDKQVLNALSEHFGLTINFEYSNSSAIAKSKYSDLKNHRLDTVANHLDLPAFKHHDALEDAKTCARIMLCLGNDNPAQSIQADENSISEYLGILKGIIADDHVNYKEAFGLLYWLEDNPKLAKTHFEIFGALRSFCEDNFIDSSKRSFC